MKKTRISEEDAAVASTHQLPTLKQGTGQAYSCLGLKSVVPKSPMESGRVISVGDDAGWGGGGSLYSG